MNDDGSDDESDGNNYEERFVDLEEDLANVIADVHDLGAPAFASGSLADWWSGMLTVVLLGVRRAFLTPKLHWVCQDCEKTRRAYPRLSDPHTAVDLTIHLVCTEKDRF